MHNQTLDATESHKHYPAVLALDKLHLKLSLGVGAAERATPQSVHMYLKIFFEKLPLSCSNDKLDDTICYDKMVQCIKDYCHGKEFKLLEYACFQIHSHLREAIDADIKLWLKIEKCTTPIAELEGPSSFAYGDL